MPLRPLRAALRDIELPAAFVDLDALNATSPASAKLLKHHPIQAPRREQVRPLYVALLARIREEPSACDGGVLAFTAAEAEHLVAHGSRDVVAAPDGAGRADVVRFARFNREGAGGHDGRRRPPAAPFPAGGRAN